MTSYIITFKEKLGLGISILIVLVAGLLELAGNCWIKNHPTITSIPTGLACGFIATIIVLYIERKFDATRLKNYYLKYQGTYMRTDMGQDYTPDSDLDNMRQENNGLIITMNYIDGHRFNVVMNYWKSVNAQAKGTVEFNPNDSLSGKGNYRYTTGGEYEGHFGQIELNWDDIKKEMIVIYKHLYPRKEANNPDKNKGWQVWAKTY